MPYKSEAQRKYFNANKKKLGAKIVEEYNRMSKGLKLPKRTKNKKKKLGKLRKAVMKEGA